MINTGAVDAGFVISGDAIKSRFAVLHRRRYWRGYLIMRKHELHAVMFLTGLFLVSIAVCADAFL